MSKPTYQEVLDSFRRFAGYDPSEKQMNHYVARDWGTLNGDLLELNFARVQERDIVIKELEKKPAPGFVVVDELLYRKK